MLLGFRNGMTIKKQDGGGSGYWGLCFTAEEANSTIEIKRKGWNPPSINLEYSTDSQTWQTFTVGNTIVSLSNVGDKVWFKAGNSGNTTFSITTNSYNIFEFNNGKIAASGNIMSLLNGEEPLTYIQSTYCFANLFGYTNRLTAAPDLPATTLASKCYYQMFYNSGITKVKVGFTSWNPTNAFSDWMYGVSGGTFYCPTALGTNETITRGPSKCPTGWTVINTDV